jgi:hypothetical protein
VRPRSTVAHVPAIGKRMHATRTRCRPVFRDHAAAMCAELPVEDRPENTMYLNNKRPGYTQRMVGFMRNVSTMKAYLTKHCSNGTLDTSSQTYDLFVKGVPAVSDEKLEHTLKLPSGVDAQVCINLTYAEDKFTCESLSHVTPFTKQRELSLSAT